MAVIAADLSTAPALVGIAFLASGISQRWWTLGQRLRSLSTATDTATPRTMPNRKVDTPGIDLARGPTSSAC